MNKEGVKFNPDEVVKPVSSPTVEIRNLTTQLSQFNRARCRCNKSKNPPYCDGSHAFIKK